MLHVAAVLLSSKIANVRYGLVSSPCICATCKS